MKKLSKKAVIIIIAACCAAVLIAGIVTTVVLLTKKPETVTVSFVTDGGKEIAPIVIEKGTVLEEEPITGKQNCTFTGWYTDVDRVEPFYVSEPIVEDTVLYAQYIVDESFAKSIGATEAYLPDKQSDYSFGIISAEEITESNLFNFLQISNLSGELPPLSVIKTDNIYTISPKTAYTEGAMYIFELTNTSACFAEQESTVRKISVDIYKAPVMNVSYVEDGFKCIDKTAVVGQVSETSFILPAELVETKAIAKGDTLCLGNGTDNLDEETLYVDVSALEKQGDNYIIYTATANLDNILGDVDIYFTDMVPLNEIFTPEYLAEIEEDMYNSPGTEQLTQLLAEALAANKTVQEMGDGSSLYDDDVNLSVFSDRASILSGTSCTIKTLVKGLTITATIGHAKNNNFAANPDAWNALSISLKYTGKLKNKVAVEATASITEYFNITLQGGAKGSGLDQDFKYAINVYSQTEYGLSVIIYSTDDDYDGVLGRKDNWVDISDSISAFTEERRPNSSNIVEQVNEALSARGGDIELCRVKILKGNYAFPPQAPIFSLNASLDFVVKFNFAAGISTNLSVLDAFQLGASGNLLRKNIRTFKNALHGSNRFSFDLSAYGYMGIKAGIVARVTLSFNQLQSMAEVGAEAEAGLYLDIYGYLQLSVSKLYTESNNIKTEFKGGLYMEIGIYFSGRLLAELGWVQVKETVEIGEIKIPIAELGTQYILLEIVSVAEKYTMHADSEVVSSSIITAMYLDLTSGISPIRPVSNSELFLRFDTRLLSYDQDTRRITVHKDKIGKSGDLTKEGDLTFKAKMFVTYTGQVLSFSTSETDAYGNTLLQTIDFLWVDPSLKLESDEDVDKEFTATIMIDCDGEKTVLKKFIAQYGKSIGDLDSFMMYEVKEKYNDAGGWDIDPSFYAMDKDTTFTYYVRKKQVRVGFVYFDGERWVSEERAVNLGEVPVVPQGSEEISGGYTFSEWKGERMRNAYAGSMPAKFNGIVPIPENIFGGAINNLLSLYCSPLQTTHMDKANIDVVCCNCNGFIAPQDAEEQKPYMFYITQAMFDLLGEVFNTFITALPTETPSVLNDTTSKEYKAYAEFYERAVWLYGFSNSGFARNANSGLENSAIVGLNNDCNISFYEDEESAIGVTLAEVAALFGFEDEDAFKAAAQTRADAFMADAKDASADKADKLRLDGAICTQNGYYILPYAIRSSAEENPYVVTYVIVDPKGNSYIWINDLQNISTITGMAETETESSDTESEQERTYAYTNNIYGRCQLFDSARYADVNKPLGEVIYSNSKQAATYAFSSDFFNSGACIFVADYVVDIAPLTVTVTMRDSNENIADTELTVEYGGNIKPFELRNRSNKYQIVGWDYNGDGIADYQNADNLPAVTADIHITAIYERVLCEVIAYDIHGDKSSYTANAYEDFDVSALDALKTPVLTAEEAKKYPSLDFLYYEVSFDNENYWRVYSNTIFVHSTTYVRAVFDPYYSVVLDAGEGSFFGIGKTLANSYKNGSEISLLTLLNNKLADRASTDEKHYSHNGWIDGEGKKYGIYDKINVTQEIHLTATYEESVRLYSLTVSCPFGGIVPGSTESSITIENLTYQGLQEKKEYYFSNLPVDNVTDKGTYTYGQPTYSKASGGNDGYAMIYSCIPPAKEIDITFNSGEGKFGDNKTEIVLDKFEMLAQGFSILEQPVREDNEYIFSFVGWKNEAGTEYAKDDANLIRNVNNDTVYTAVYRNEGRREYTISFVSPSGKFVVDNDYVDTVVYKGYYNDEFYPENVPAYPVDIEEYDSYNNVCNGWDIQIPTNFTQDYIITAVWIHTPKVYSLEYYVNGILHYSEQHSYLDDLTERGIPEEAEGNTWAGWRWSVPNRSTAYSVMPQQMPASNLRADGTITRYYAIYVINGIEDRRDYHSIGTDVTVDALPVTLGYTYSDWACAGASVWENAFTMPENNVTFSTIKTANEYSVTYKIDGIVAGDIQTNKYGKTVSLRAEPYKKGYTFSGWNTNDAELQNGRFVMPDKQVEVNGSFTVNSYDVVYCVGGETIYTDTTEYGENVTVRADEERQELIFSGWSSGDITIQEGGFTMPANNVTILGDFSSGEYIISYCFEGQTITQRHADAGVNVTIPQASIAVPKGYEITGWTCEDTEISDNSFVMPEQNVTVNAVFTEKTYNIIYKESQNGEQLASYTAAYGDIVELDSTEYLVHGKYSNGWSLAEGTADVTVVNNSFTMSAQDVVFVANWQSCLTVSDGTNIDRFDTDSPSVYGYTYDSEQKLLTIEGSGLTLSGKIEDVLIYIRAESTTLYDLEVISSADGYFYRFTDDYDVDNGYFYNGVYNCETDAVVIVDIATKYETELLIKGTVTLCKNDETKENYEGWGTKHLAGIATIDSDAQIKCFDGAYSMLEDGVFTIKGVGEDACLLIDTTASGTYTDEYRYGIYTQLSFIMSDINCNINCTNYGIYANNTELNSVKLEVTSLPDYDAVCIDAMFSGNACELTLTDCEISILGRVYAGESVTFKGNTFGHIHALASYAVAANYINIEVDEGNEIKFSVAGGLQDISAIRANNDIVLSNGNTFITPQNAVVTQHTIGQTAFTESFIEVPCGDVFVAATSVTIGCNAE